MKVIGYILRLTNWLVAVGFGVIGFAWASDIINIVMIGNFIDQINTNPSVRMVALLLTVYIVLFNLLYFLSHLFVRQYATHIKLNVASGEFSISLSAIENSLRRAVKKLAEVHDIHIRIRKDKKSEAKPIVITAYYSAWEGTNVQEVTAKIQEMIHMRFQEIVEVKEPPVFQLYLTNIVERDHKKSDSKKKSDLIEQGMFYGPQYPVDSE
ncbi:MAG: hypothetical protein HY811_06555 [Planctomycetes bacterium]|nr:hypothetical protein [Planctomycetota bacterium]